MLLNRRAFVRLTGLSLVAPAALAAPTPVDLEAVGTSLRALGYVATRRAAQKPLLVKGQPAQAILIGDAHTAEGHAFTRQAIQDVKRFAAPDTLLVEGVGFTREAQRQLEAEAKRYATRAQAASLTPEEATLLLPGQNLQPAVSFTPYAREAGIRRVLGLEDAQASLASEVLNAFEILRVLVAQAQTGGKAIVRINGKYAGTGQAKLFLTLETLRARYGMAAPSLSPASLSSLVATRKDGLRLDVDVLTPETPGLRESFRRLDMLADQLVMGERNVSVAGHVRNVFERSDASATDLVIFGRGHFRLTAAGGPSLLDRLSAGGITTLAVLPGVGQPSAGLR